VKIEFDRDQFETLIRLLYLGNWMANAYSDESENGEFVELIHYICSQAADNMGLAEYMAQDMEAPESITPETLNEIQYLNELIEEYDDAVFLDKLIYNLADRDMLNKFGEKKIEAMTEEDFFREEAPFVQKYQREFARSGIQNLVVNIEKPAKGKTTKGKR